MVRAFLAISDSSRRNILTYVRALGINLPRFNPKYLATIRTMPCAVGGCPGPGDPSHLAERFGEAEEALRFGLPTGCHYPPHRRMTTGQTQPQRDRVPMPSRARSSRAGMSSRAWPEYEGVDDEDECVCGDYRRQHEI